MRSKQKPGKNDISGYTESLVFLSINHFMLLLRKASPSMIHNPIKNLIRNILLQTEGKESISKWYAFLITLSSKTIPSIFKMNNLPHYYNTEIFGMGITNHLVAVPSEKHLYPFSAIIVSLDQFFIQKVLSYYISRLNVFVCSRSVFHSWKLFCKNSSSVP